MGRFQWSFSFGVYGSYDLAIFRLADGREQIKVTFPVLLFPASKQPSQSGGEGKGGECWPAQRTTYSLDLGQRRAAFRMYSGPRTNVFHRLAAFRWSFLGLKAEASSLAQGISI